MSTGSSEPPPEPAPYLTDEEARRWFYHLGGGGHVLDRHLTIVRDVFGADVPYRVTAAVNRWSRRPTQLFIEIDLPIDDEESQDRVIRVEQGLLEEEAELRSLSGRARPYSNISVVLAGAPRRWDAAPEGRHAERES